jgi:hypothetical protein
MVDEETVECPECGGRLPAGASFCVHCESDLASAESGVDLSELDGLFGPDDPPEFLVETDRGERKAARPVRLLAALAVSIPIAPLVFFLVNSVVSLSAWSGLAVLLVGWLGPALYFSRARLPAEAFGKSLFVIAAGTALVPVALYLRPVGVLERTDMTGTFGAIVALALVVAGVSTALGYFVTGQAQRRVDGDLRYFEEYREE